MGGVVWGLGHRVCGWEVAQPFHVVGGAVVRGVVAVWVVGAERWRGYVRCFDLRIMLLFR